MILFLVGCLTKYHLNLKNVLEQSLQKEMIEYEFNEKFSVIQIETQDDELTVSKVEYFYNKEPAIREKRVLKEINIWNLVIKVSLLIFNCSEDIMVYLIDLLVDEELKTKITDIKIFNDPSLAFLYDLKRGINIFFP